MRNQSTKEQQIRGQNRDCRSVVRSREILFYKLCNLKGKQAIQDQGEKKKNKKTVQQGNESSIKIVHEKSLPSVRMVIIELFKTK